MDAAQPDVLACMSIPAPHRTKLHGTNPLERLIGEIKRRSAVAGIFPDEPAIAGWPAPSCSNRTTNGQSSVPAT
jgi:transposase-like protein